MANTERLNSTNEILMDEEIKEGAEQEQTTTTGSEPVETTTSETTGTSTESEAVN